MKSSTRFQLALIRSDSLPIREISDQLPAVSTYHKLNAEGFIQGFKIETETSWQLEGQVRSEPLSVGRLPYTYADVLLPVHPFAVLPILI